MSPDRTTTIRIDLRTNEAELARLIGRIDAAWREKRFDDLDSCFHRDAVITGPGYVELASGRQACAESYREFARNARVLAYTESGHRLRVWEHSAVYTFAWKMSFERDQGPVHEKGTDQMVFQKGADGWQVVWRHVHFEPRDVAAPVIP